MRLIAACRRGPLKDALKWNRAGNEERSLIVYRQHQMTNRTGVACFFAYEVRRFRFILTG